MAKIRGTGSNDLLNGTGAGDEINGMDGNDIIYGHGGRDALTGDGGNDYVYGGAGNDHVVGGPGDDYLYGEDGNDTLFSGTGADHLFGGLDADVFDYRYGVSGSNSKLDPFTGMPSGIDTIHDFERGIDKIDLSAIDANATTPIGHRTGNEAFTYVVSTDGITPGQLTIAVENGNTIIRAYTDTAPGADFELVVLGTGSSGEALVTPGDFWL